MIAFIGSGMGDYNLKALSERIDWNLYDKIFLDPNYKNQKVNDAIFLNNDKWVFDSFSNIKKMILEMVSELKNINIAYVITGSPGFYSAATLILKSIEKNNPDFNRKRDLQWFENQSCKDYILEYAKIPEQEVEVTSLHGRSQLDMTAIFRKRYTIILCDNLTIEKLQEAFRYLNSTDYQITLFSKMNYENEKIISIDDLNRFAIEFNGKEWSPYTILLEKKYNDVEKYSSDKDFSHQRGMITKDYKRYLSIFELELFSNLILWDIGASSGSIGIEAYKLFKVKTYFFEINKERITFLKENLIKHKVINSFLIEGNALSCSKKIEENPDRIFIGGGGKELTDNILYFYERLNPGGIIIINYVALNYLSTAIELLEKNKLNFEVKAISLTNYKTLKVLLPEGERVMYQFKIKKGRNNE